MLHHQKSSKIHTPFCIFAMSSFIKNTNKHTFLLQNVLVQNRDSYSLQQFRPYALFQSKKHNKKRNKSNVIENQWLQKSMQKTSKNDTFFHHRTAICLSISTWSTSVNASKQCSKFIVFSIIIHHLLNIFYRENTFPSVSSLLCIFELYTKKHHFQQRNTRFRTTYQAKIRKQHVFLHIFIFARNARKFMIKIHGNTFSSVSF